MLVTKKVDFAVKRHSQNGRLYISVEGSSELFSGSNYGEIGLEIPPQLTEEKANEIALYLQNKLRGLSLTITNP